MIAEAEREDRLTLVTPGSVCGAYELEYRSNAW
jgi:hypothetical protein